MKNNNITIKKIPLDSLIDTLVDLYNQGVDYIDIEGQQGDGRDYMAIAFNKEYMMEEAVKNFEEIPNCITEEDITKSKLSDEDLNDLI